MMLAQDNNIAKNVTTFMMSRLLLFLGILTITVFLRQEIYGFEIVVNIYSILALTFFLSLASVLFWDDVLRMNYFIPSQMFYDILLTSLLIFYTGISESIFLFLYIINIILAAVIYQLHGALILAFLAGTIYAVLFYINKSISQDALLYSLLYNELFFLITALLCGQLMDEMVKQRKLLASQQADLNSLRDLKHLLLNNIPAAVILVDSDNNITEANKTAIEEFNIGDWHLDWINIEKVIPDLERIRVTWNILTEREKLLYRFKFGRNTYSLQLVFFEEKEKETVETKSNSQNFIEEAPDMMIVIQNISKLSALETKLHNESKLATIGQFAAGLAHEIRNPLASISGATESLLRLLKNLSDDERKLLNITITESKRVNKLITDFLQFARPAPLEFHEVKLAEVVDETVFAVSSRKYQGQELIIENNIDKSFVVNVDHEKLKQVLLNLILNSMQACEKNESIFIEIDASIENDLVQIVYQDNGPGIPKDKQSKIFEPFFTTKKSGTGLGLSTVSQIINAHQGKIELVDTDFGARFQIFLPLNLGVDAAEVS